MSQLVTPLELAHDPETGLPIAPSVDAWNALDIDAQDRLVESMMDALSEWELTLAPEGTRHDSAQRDAMDRFGRHFDQTKRGVFLAANLMVHYPDERPFAPDLIAVLDVPLHHRNSWGVAREGKGPDFALELLFSGDRKKDLGRNVAWFARLGIAEYFVFDGGRRNLYGWHLPEDGSSKYLPIVPQAGQWHSAVLGLDLTIVGGQLKLFKDGAPVLATAEQAALWSQMLDETQSALAVETKRAEDEGQRAEYEAERAARESARADATLDAMRAAFRDIVHGRGWTVDAALEARLARCDDAARLGGWLAGAALAKTAEQLAPE